MAGAGGFLNTGGNFGGALAAVLTPWIVSEIGWIGALAVASLFAVMGGVRWMGVDPTKCVVTGHGLQFANPALLGTAQEGEQP